MKKYQEKVRYAMRCIPDPRVLDHAMRHAIQEMYKKCPNVRDIQMTQGTDFLTREVVLSFTGTITYGWFEYHFRNFRRSEWLFRTLSLVPGTLGRKLVSRLKSQPPKSMRYQRKPRPKHRRRNQFQHKWQVTLLVLNLFFAGANFSNAMHLLDSWWCLLLFGFAVVSGVSSVMAYQNLRDAISESAYQKAYAESNTYVTYRWEYK